MKINSSLKLELFNSIITVIKKDGFITKEEFRETFGADNKWANELIEGIVVSFEGLITETSEAYVAVDEE